MSLKQKKQVSLKLSGPSDIPISIARSTQGSDVLCRTFSCLEFFSPNDKLPIGSLLNWKWTSVTSPKQGLRLLKLNCSATLCHSKVLKLILNLKLGVITTVLQVKHILTALSSFSWSMVILIMLIFLYLKWCAIQQIHMDSGCTVVFSVFYIIFLTFFWCISPIYWGWFFIKVYDSLLSVIQQWNYSTVKWLPLMMSNLGS